MRAIAFLLTFQSLATQLCTIEIGMEWVALADENDAVTPELAAEFANLGFLPSEAKAEMAAGETPKSIRRRETATQYGRGPRWTPRNVP